MNKGTKDFEKARKYLLGLNKEMLVGLLLGITRGKNADRLKEVVRYIRKEVKLKLKDKPIKVNFLKRKKK